MTTPSPDSSETTPAPDSSDYHILDNHILAEIFKYNMCTENAALCSICFSEIDTEPPSWIYGHNAQPVNNGRCCAACNDNIVVPARIKIMMFKKPAVSS